MLDDAALQRMTLTAYEAATDASRWHVLMEDMRRTFNASTASIFTPVVGVDQRLLSAAAGMDAEVQAIIAQWVTKDPWLKTRLQKRLPMDRGMAPIGSEYLPWSQLETTQFYNECGKVVGIRALVTLIIEDDNGRYGVPRTHLALTRPPGFPEFEEREAQFLKALWKPLRAAVQSYFALERVQALAQPVQEALEAMPQPVFVLDGVGKIIFSNRAGLVLLQRPQVVHTAVGCIKGIGNLTGELWQAILQATRSNLQAPAPFWWADSAAVRNGVAYLGRLCGVGSLPAHWAGAEVLLSIEVDQPERRQQAQLAGLARLYGLTPAEARVLARLSEGLRPESVAQHECIAVSTVRTHISHLLEKTGTSGVLELLRLLGS